MSDDSQSTSAAPSSPDLAVDAAYLEQMQRRWQQDPESVPESWRYFFVGMAYAYGGPSATIDDCAGARRTAGDRARKQSNIANLVASYRRQGYLVASTNPLTEEQQPPQLRVLSLHRWNFSEDDLDTVFDAGLLLDDSDQLTLREILQELRETYCGSLGVEYMHVRDRGARMWLQRQMESTRNRPVVSVQRKLAILEALTDAEVFEKFTHSRYLGQKRFSLEGAETLIAGLQAVVESAPALGIEEFVIGMAHRGRLNVLANLMGMSYEMIFSEFEGNFLPDSVQGHGDVKYHKGYSCDWCTKAGQCVHLSLTANPSHLEAVDPVVQGKARAKQRRHRDTEGRTKVVPLLIHGDAAFTGQGIVAETFNMSQLVGYRTGGTLHVVVNNQIGFTTPPEEGRSTGHCTDVAKMVDAPIFHVNGDDPEAVLYALDLALRYRQQFSRDVVVDMVCYRRHGHNESDDPALTQPLLYSKIQDRPSVREIYTRRLLSEGALVSQQAEHMADAFRERLDVAQQTAKRGNVELQVQAFEGLWKGMDGPFRFDPIDTRVSQQKLEQVARALCTVPAGFQLNPKVARPLPKRLEAVQQAQHVDWAFSELLALGSLLQEGTPVRLSGQDSARGTFSQRHSVWQDKTTQQAYIPLNHISEQQERFCVYNSALSEAAVLGFEYGYSLSEPNMLIMWEAQFGDFVNGAQAIVDQFILGAESKWQRDSGIVLLLPHGYEGQGPEHSNAYLERFLQGCAETNVQVCYPSTPAQYFHLLRRQVRRDIRLPLIVMTPKSMLRHKRVVSSVSELTDGSFEEFLPDLVTPASPRRLVLCAGKLFWDLVEQRERDHTEDVGIVRVEQFYPLNWDKLHQVLKPYREVGEVVWAQEEPQNRGGWTAMLPHLLELFPDRPLGYVGREASASSATGSLKRHRQSQAEIIQKTLHGKLAKDRDESGNQSTGRRRVDYRGGLSTVV